MSELAQSNKGVVAIEGVDLPYVREGQGKPILVIGSSIFYSKAFSDRLRKHFELIFVDGRHFVPSYNPSPEELDKISLETFVDDLEEDRRILGIEKTAVLGHSVHAQIAIRYAVKYPQHTSHLILVCGVPYAFAEFAQQVLSFWKANASKERKDTFARNRGQLEEALAAAPATRSFAVRYQMNGPQYWSDPAYDAEKLLEGLENGVTLERLTATLPGRAEVRQALEKLEMPIFLVLGKHDYAVPYAVWEELSNGLENITYVLLNESSHNPMTEHPELFDEKLIFWFEDQ